MGGAVLAVCLAVSDPVGLPPNCPTDLRRNTRSVGRRGHGRCHAYPARRGNGAQHRRPASASPQFSNCPDSAGHIENSGRKALARRSSADAGILAASHYGRDGHLFFCRPHVCLASGSSGPFALCPRLHGRSRSTGLDVRAIVAHLARSRCHTRLLLPLQLGLV